MKIEVGVRSDIGRARVRNEDAYLVQEPLFVVADGMGGHRGGNVASSLAVETLEGAIDAARAGDLEGVVEQIQRANQRVMERGGSDHELRGMGTTLTALLTGDGKAHIAHVGDSRAYRLRDDTLQQLTEDHSLVQRMVREGKLSEEEAATHPQRNILTRVLGVEDDMPVDQLTLDVREGDRLLLCTDGLTNMVDRDRIQEILRSEPDPQAACDRLIDAANRAGGDDNITVIVVDFVTGDADGTEAAPRRSSIPAPDGGTRTADGSSAEADRSQVAAAEAPRGQRRPRRRRVAIWAGAILVVLGVGLIASRMYIDRQWYVGDADGRVAIYKGIPAEVGGLKLSHVQETTELSAAEVQRYQVWRDLQGGITAKSFQDAEAIVASMRRQVQQAQPAGGGG